MIYIYDNREDVVFIEIFLQRFDKIVFAKLWDN